MFSKFFKILSVLLLSGSFLLGACSPSRLVIAPSGTKVVHTQTEFSTEYVNEHRGNVFVEIPEAYELANIAIAVSTEGLENPNRVLKEGEYYQQVLEQFMPYQDHPLIQAINYADDRLTEYYQFRENALGYHFVNDKLVHAGVYSTNFGQDRFGENLELLNDFAEKSGFRQFYADHAEYYAAQIDSYRQKVPIEAMWSWLEDEFSNRHDSYKVVFSPLILASHSTQTYADNNYSETVMFVGGPDLYISKAFEPAVEEGLLARVVFTEIDHNYVNPVTRHFNQKVNEAFGDLEQWNAQTGSGFYGSPETTFNEYMTWAVFVLYAHEMYSPEVAGSVIDYTVELMENGRGFYRFGDFAEALVELSNQRAADQSIPDLYGPILDWAATVSP